MIHAESAEHGIRPGSYVLLCARPTKRVEQARDRITDTEYQQLLKAAREMED